MGYERKVFSRENVDTYVGGAYTRYGLPSSFQSAYQGPGQKGNPQAVEFSVRLYFHKHKTLK
jgi:hypothetical protein